MHIYSILCTVYGIETAQVLSLKPIALLYLFLSGYTCNTNIDNFELKIVGNKKKIASKIVKAVCENKNSVTILIVTIHTYTAASSCHIVAASLTEILPTFSSSWPAISSTSTSKKNDADKVALGKQMA